MCGDQYSYGKRLRCAICDFDICNSCEKNIISKKNGICHNGHGFINVKRRIFPNDPRKFADWICDICNDKHSYNNEKHLCCPYCDIDICVKCTEIGKNSEKAILIDNFEKKYNEKYRETDSYCDDFSAFSTDCDD